ncbi:uncharacterized protein ACN63O_001863 [Diretmus argenteus]
MEQEEELEQIATWLEEEGLSPDAPVKDQLCFLWRGLQHRESCLVVVTSDLDTQRSQHMVELSEVRKSLEQIRIFTEQKDVLAQEIQEENDRLKDQLHRLMCLQDAQISEVAKMLYQQGLTELIHSSPSEQVAYLLVERSSLLEREQDADGPVTRGDAPPAGQPGVLGQKENTDQYGHKGAPRHGHSPWKRLFGLHKAAQSKHTFIPAEFSHVSGQASNMERECSRLERDLEEGSRRLAMAHNEIRRLTNELESAHLTQSAYEPELQDAQQEVDQLRQEVEKLRECEMVELRKAKELNTRLDHEIRALRTRVRSLDAERSSLQEMVASLQKEVGRLESALQEQKQEAKQQLLYVQAHTDQASDAAKGSRPDHHKGSQDECERLKEEICDVLKCLDHERSKCHEMNEKHKAKVYRAKRKFTDETQWRDDRIRNLERELSLCVHSIAKEKERIANMTVENEKLLSEKRKLLQQVNEQEHIKNDSIVAASVSKCRMDFLETENKTLGNKIVQMSNELVALERTRRNLQKLHLAEELKKISTPKHVFLTSSPLQTSRPAEMGYLNLTSATSSDHSSASGFLSSTDSNKV